MDIKIISSSALETMHWQQVKVLHAIICIVKRKAWRQLIHCKEKHVCFRRRDRQIERQGFQISCEKLNQHPSWFTWIGSLQHNGPIQSAFLKIPPPPTSDIWVDSGRRWERLTDSIAYSSKSLYWESWTVSGLQLFSFLLNPTNRPFTLLLLVRTLHPKCAHSSQ